MTFGCLCFLAFPRFFYLILREARWKRKGGFPDVNVVLEVQHDMVLD